MDLPARWPLDGAIALRDRLLAAYAEPARGYHDLRHLTEVLLRLDELARTAATHMDPVAVRLAAWFHDAVYDARPDPEERSAAWAEAALPEANVAGGVIAEVARLVRLTADHRPAADDLAGQLLTDADLAILASSPSRYADYVAGVRREFAHVDDESFRLGRARVLRDLLAKPTLFHTAYAREHWEDGARVNVARELAALA